jgi:hypothetical protein
MGTAPATGAEAPVRPGLLRGRLFRKYLLLIISLVSVALLASGGIGLYFSYQEHRAALASLQREKAVAAASRIEQYLRQVSQQLTYAALPQIDAGDVELRRIEFLKLLRQAPEVTDIAQIDGSGREQLAVSRLGMDVVASGKDRSGEPAFQQARRGQPWYGPVYFRKETEPYMTVATRSGGPSSPVTVAEVNLKFIWDVVSRIRIGDKGKAYVVDAAGLLVADPDIGLVLRKTSMAALPHVVAARDVHDTDAPAMESVDLAGVAGADLGGADRAAGLEGVCRAAGVGGVHQAQRVDPAHRAAAAGRPGVLGGGGLGAGAQHGAADPHPGRGRPAHRRRRPRSADRRHAPVMSSRAWPTSSTA